MVRSAAGGPLNEGMVCVLKIPTACKGDTAVGDIVSLTSAQWTLHSTVVDETLLRCGVVRQVNSASTLAAVEMLYFKNAIRLNVSTDGVKIGSQVYMGKVANCHEVITSGIIGIENYVIESGSADCVVLLR